MFLWKVAEIKSYLLYIFYVLYFITVSVYFIFKLWMCYFMVLFLGSVVVNSNNPARMYCIWFSIPVFCTRQAAAVPALPVHQHHLPAGEPDLCSAGEDADEGWHRDCSAGACGHQRHAVRPLRRLSLSVSL